MLLVVTMPIGLPGIGVMRDRHVQRQLESAAGRGVAAPSPGFAVPSGTMVLVAALHLALLIGLLVPGLHRGRRPPPVLQLS